MQNKFFWIRRKLNESGFLKKTIEIFRSYAGSDAIIECNTNGDLLTVDLISSIFEAGLTYLYVKLYDSESQENKFIELFSRANISESRWKLRRHYDEQEFGLYITNRSGMLKGYEEQVKSDRQRYYPFYKLMIDYNANVLFCTNDWGRE